MFLCTGNSCRSQMAEGITKHYGKGFIEPYSAGVMPSHINPRAIQVMNEIGIDISKQFSKPIDEDLLMKMDIIITLCGQAEASCPVTPPQIKRLHWPINDPASATGTEEEILNTFREARDEIKEKIINFIKEIKDSQKHS